MTLLFWLSIKGKSNVFQRILLGFFLLILLGAIGCVYYSVYPWPIKASNILVFTLLYLYCVWSYQGVNLDMSRVIVFQKESHVLIFFLAYLIGVVLYMAVFVPKAIGTFQLGDFLQSYQEMRNGTIDRFDNTIQKWLYYFAYRLNFPALIVGFNYLCDNKIAKGVSIILAAVSVVLVWAIYIVSRTEIFQIIIVLFVLFLLYRKYMPQKVLKGFSIVLLVSFAIVSFAVFLITASRTAFKSDNLWVFNYFGRSLLTFNSIMEYPVTAKDGIYFLGTQTYFNIAHPSYDGHEFVCLFGRMYMDFGWLGLLVFLSMPLFLPKKKISLPDFYMLLWIFDTILLGVMYSNFTISEIIFAILIYISLKLFFHSPSIRWKSTKN